MHTSDKTDVGAGRQAGRAGCAMQLQVQVQVVADVSSPCIVSAWCIAHTRSQEMWCIHTWWIGSGCLHACMQAPTQATHPQPKHGSLLFVVVCLIRQSVDACVPYFRCLVVATKCPEQDIPPNGPWTFACMHANVQGPIGGVYGAGRISATTQNM